MKAKRAYLVQPRKFEIREEEILPGNGQVIIKVASCGLCNWELNHWKGNLGTPPMTLGHELAGTIIETYGDPGVLKVGDNVTVLPSGLRGFADYVVENVSNCYKLADGIDPKEAFGEPLKCIITVLRASSAEPGDNGIIVGCGPMGLWCIQALAGKYLSSLIAVDTDPKRLELARLYGATHTVNPLDCKATDEISKITNGHLGDFVIEGTGNASVFGEALKYIRTNGRGRMILMSSYEGVCPSLDIRPAIERSVQIIAAHPSYPYSHEDDMRRAADLINRRVFKMDNIITHSFKLTDINEAFQALENKPSGYIKGIVLP